MIEIIKRGVPYEDRMLEIQCPRCLSVLRFIGNEVLEGVTFSYIVCPVCSPEEDGWINVAKATPV